MSPQQTGARHAAVIAALEDALRDAASPALAQSLQRYFPAPVAALGVSNATVMTLATTAVSGSAALAVDDWLGVADHFARSHAYHEHLMLASALLARVARRVDDDGRLLDLVQTWLEAHVGNWAQCDDLCIKPLYIYLKDRPDLQARIYAWGASGSPWCRRASNVALVKFVGRTDDFDLAPMFANCRRLLADADPYVQKGVGWMLKVASQHALPEVLAFLHEHAAVMARPTLRDAIEKLPPGVRRVFSPG